MGGVGDVYYCTSDVDLDIKKGKLSQYNTAKFKFLRKSSEIQIKQNEGILGYITLDDQIYDSGKEIFTYRYFDTFVFLYKFGRFNLTHTTYDKIVVMSGSCSIF